MDASLQIQGNIHDDKLIVQFLRLCPEYWVHIIFGSFSKSHSFSSRYQFSHAELCFVKTIGNSCQSSSSVISESFFAMKFSPCLPDRQSVRKRLSDHIAKLDIGMIYAVEGNGAKLLGVDFSVG